MANKKIREQIQAAGLRHWQVAEAAGISEYTLCVWLRRTLAGERLTKVQDAINNLISGRCDGNEDADY